MMSQSILVNPFLLGLAVTTDAGVVSKMDIDDDLFELTVQATTKSRSLETHVCLGCLNQIDCWLGGVWLEIKRH